jgi:hypothetical protein
MFCFLSRLHLFCSGTKIEMLRSSYCIDPALQEL